MEHDFGTAFVDDDLMVVPAEDDQLTLIGPPALGPEGQMMNLEPVPAGATVGGTSESGLSEQHPFQRWRSCPGPSSVIHISPVGRPGHDFNVGVTQDRFESVATDPDS